MRNFTEKTSTGFKNFQICENELITNAKFKKETAALIRIQKELPIESIEQFNHRHSDNHLQAFGEYKIKTFYIFLIGFNTLQEDLFICFS